MNRRMIAMAAAIAVATLAGAHPVMAGQCEASCDKSFAQCNGTNPDTSKCLPMWGQCKRGCSPTRAKTTAMATPVKVTKVAQAASTRPKPK